MNQSEYELRKENIWETAANPDITTGFFIFAGGWLIICWLVGVCMNGLVLLTFAVNKSVSHFFT